MPKNHIFLERLLIIFIIDVPVSAVHTVNDRKFEPGCLPIQVVIHSDDLWNGSPPVVQPRRNPEQEYWANLPQEVSSSRSRFRSGAKNRSALLPNMGSESPNRAYRNEVKG